MKRVWLLSSLLVVIMLLALMLSLTMVSADFGDADWEARFYNCDDLSCGVIETETYTSGLNFNWSGRPEDDNGDDLILVDEDDFSVKFDATQEFQQGQYQFEITVTDGVRFLIDGEIFLDEYEAGGQRTFTFIVEFSETADYDLRVEFFNEEDDAILQVQWFFEDEIVDAATSTPAPTATPDFINASVVRVNGLSLRTGPFLGASLVGVLRPGNTYRLVAQNNSEGLFTWYYLTTDSGYSGWASGRYLELETDAISLPERSTNFESAGGLPDLGIIAVPRANMNVRVYPSTRTGRITQLAWGGEAQLLARTIQGGKDFWYLVRFDGVTGWIYAPFVGVRGDINNVPIY